MARQTVLISDFTGKELTESEGCTITLKFNDARKGLWVADAHPDDPIVKLMRDNGRKEARRGRKPKGTAA